MELDFDLNTKPLDLLRDALEKAGEEIITELAQTQIVNIRLRVQNGVGVRDQKMKKYTTEYAKFKSNKGRNTNKRDLTFTGTMLRSIHTESIKETSTGWEATLSFTNREDAIKGFYNQQIDPWFGVSPKDQRILNKVALKQLQRSIQEQS